MNERSFTHDTPELVAWDDLDMCAIVHRYYPRLDLVCGKGGDMPCVREVLDKARSFALALRGAFDTPAEQARQ